MKTRLFILIFLLSSISGFSQERPKIGLALSGGGAKGLAHIGLLKAIDSVGINIDYIAGTSMGSIVGGLYALGYSGNQIEQIARSMNWDRMLTNRPSYEQLYLPFKDDNKQWVEVPMIGTRIQVGTGILESNELWLWLNEKFSAFNLESDFTNLPIPFRCVTTRLDNGEVIVLKNGNLPDAIRASMAIPTVFTPVPIDNMSLVDGGLVRNFPVNEVREMGADLVIGSSVSEQELSDNDLDNPIKIVSQIAFFAEQRDYLAQKESTDIFVSYPIAEYGAGSFSSANEIVNIGIKKGEEMLPILQRFKDALDLAYGIDAPRHKKPMVKDTIKVNRVIPTGLNLWKWHLYNRQLRLVGGQEYTVSQISNRIRDIHVIGNFRKINYYFTPNEDESYDMHLNFERGSKKHFRSGITYNDDTGLGLKAGIVWNEPFNLFSKASVGLSIGENPKINAHTLQFLSNARNLFIETSLSGELTKKTFYNANLATAGSLHQNQMDVELHLAKMFKRNFQIGAGIRWDVLNYVPEIQTAIRPKGEMNFLNTFFRLRYNNQNSATTPERGTKINFETGWVFNQKYKFKFIDEDTNQSTPLDVVQDNFLSIKYNSSHYHTAGKQTYYAIFDAGTHFGNQLPYIHDFAVGGTNQATYNQITYPGFRLNGISTSSAASGHLGIRQNFSSRISLALGINGLWHDFVKNNFKDSDRFDNTVYGLNLTAAYDFLMGPLEITLMYNSINQKLIPTFNVGYSMNFTK